MPIIKDPKMNPNKEANFGVLYDDRTDKEAYRLYYKGDFTEGNPKRYFTAGTEVTIDGDPLDLTENNYHYKSGSVNANIKDWVQIANNEASGTGSVVRQINVQIRGNIVFPSEKELLSKYTKNSPSS